MSTEEKKSPVPPSSGLEAEAAPGGECSSSDSAQEGEETLEAKVERLSRELAAKSAEAAANYDRYLRERADLENFKKRSQREKAEALKFANESLIRELIPILDNLERAIEHAESGGNGQPLVAGVRLVLKEALDVLERHGVTRVDAAGQPFDPARHEAVQHVVDAAKEPNQVVEQFLPGYFLHERLLRAAQVSVSGKAAQEDKSEPPVENPEDDD
jgi:molecular chaperone GrpE